MARVKEYNLIRRAIKERWPIKVKDRKGLIGVLLDAAHAAEDVRSKVAACRAVIEADKLNMEQEKREAGGETLNVNLKTDVRDLTDDQLAAIAAAHARRGRSGTAGPANGAAAP